MALDIIFIVIVIVTSGLTFATIFALINSLTTNDFDLFERRLTFIATITLMVIWFLIAHSTFLTT